MLTLHIAAPDHHEDYTELAAVHLPAAHGQWSVHPGHAEAFATLTKGTVKAIQGDGRAEPIAIESGSVYVHDDVVTVML